jgi:hypothetical protein
MGKRRQAGFITWHERRLASEARLKKIYEGSIEATLPEIEALQAQIEDLKRRENEEG